MMKGPQNEIAFGVEIETHIPALSPVVVGRYHDGTPVDCLPATEDGKMWKAERDSSIDYPSGRQPCEFVSPILRGTKGMEMLAASVAKIKELDAKVNSSCGVHVTVEWTGDQAALARLIHLVANYEQAFYGSTGTKSRERGHYCCKIKAYGNADAVRVAATQSRYHILNLTHLASGGNRVEFRCFSASLNIGKITGWVMMCLASVQVALDGHIRAFEHTEPETAVACMERFMKSMNWISGGNGRIRGRVYPADNTPTIMPNFKFVKAELKRMAAAYDAE
jgi:hypothetical protein